MKKNCVFLGLVAVVLSACGSGSSGSAGSSTVTSLDSLPTVNASEFISTAGNASLSAPPPSTSKGLSVSKAQVGTTGTFSRSGCECRQIKKEIISQARQIELNNCYVQKLGAAFGLVIPTGSFSFIQFDNVGGESVRARFQNAGDGTFQMDVCEQRSGAFTQFMSYDLTPGSTVSGTIVDKFLASGATSEDKKKLTFTINDYTEGGATVGFSSAKFTSSFTGDFGDGSASVTANNATDFNEVSADFSGDFGGNDFTGHMFCQFNNSNGSAKYSATGSMPVSTAESFGITATLRTACGIANSSTNVCPLTTFNETQAPGANNCPAQTATGASCSFTASGTEAFSVSGSGSSESALVVASSGNSFFSTVNNATLISGSVATPTVEFQRTWDCTPGAGVFTVLDAGGVSVSTCNAIQTDLTAESFESNCQQQEDVAELTESLL